MRVALLLFYLAFSKSEEDPFIGCKRTLIRENEIKTGFKKFNIKILGHRGFNGLSLSFSLLPGDQG